MPDDLAMAAFKIPVTFVNGSEDYLADAAGTLFVLVSYDDPTPPRPKSVQVFRQQADGALLDEPVVKLTPAQSYLGGRLLLGPAGEGLVRAMGKDYVSRSFAIPGFAPVRPTAEPLIHPVALEAPWTPYGPPHVPPPTYRRLADGLIVLQGVARGLGTNAIESRVTVLPVGYRPDARLSFSVNAGQAWTSAVGRLDVLPDGQVLVMTKNANWVSLAGVTFYGGQG